jgi:hypothetical protein
MCKACSERVDNCEECKELVNVGGPIKCTDCGMNLVPRFDGTECFHKNCLAVSSDDIRTCEECPTGHYLLWDTAGCVQSCPTGYMTYEGDNFTPKTCGPSCTEGEFMDRRDKLCYACGIGSCTECRQTSDLVVRCTECGDGDLGIGDNGEKCSACGIDEVFHPFDDSEPSVGVGCQRCDQHVAGCDRCDWDEDDREVECTGCIAGQSLQENWEGEIECQCPPFQGLFDNDEGEKVCASCEIVNCLSCSSSGTAASPETTCNSCDEYNFLLKDKSGCVQDSCFARFGSYCGVCNLDRFGQNTLLKAGDACVEECPWPTTEKDGECECPLGYFRGESGQCEKCEAGCRKCTRDGCSECFDSESPEVDSRCCINCDQFEERNIHDYTPGIGGDRCVENCPQNAVESNAPLDGLNTPMCRYCSDDCEACIEDSEVDFRLYCVKCEGEKVGLGKNCVERCPESKCWMEDNGFCRLDTDCVDE